MWVFVNNGARKNFMTPTYVKEHEMTVNPEELAMNPSDSDSGDAILDAGLKHLLECLSDSSAV